MAKRTIVSRNLRRDEAKAGMVMPDEEVRTYAAEWKCNSCGTSPISGLVKVCPNCTHPKDGSETYDKPIQKGALLTDSQLAAVGVDRNLHLSDEKCSHCGAHLQPGTATCTQCGALIDDVGYTTEKCEFCGREYSGDSCPNCGGVEPQQEYSVPAQHVPAPPPLVTLPRFPELHMLPKPNVNYKSVGIALGVLAILVIIVLMLWPREHVATVVDHTWKRTIYTEEYRKLAGDGWDVPSTGEVYSSESRVKDVIQVSDGFSEQCRFEKQQVGSVEVSDTVETCETVQVYDYTEEIVYDDGTYEEIDHTRPEERCTDEVVTVLQPVYDDVKVCTMVEQFHPENVYATYYFYYYWAWVSATPLVEQGNDLYPFWPVGSWTATYRQDGNGVEKYEVLFESSNGNTYTYTPETESEYRLFEERSTWKITTVSGVVTQAIKE